MGKDGWAISVDPDTAQEGRQPARVGIIPAVLLHTLQWVRTMFAKAQQQGKLSCQAQTTRIMCDAILTSELGKMWLQAAGDPPKCTLDWLEASRFVSEPNGNADKQL